MTKLSNIEFLTQFNSIHSLREFVKIFSETIDYAEDIDFPAMTELIKKWEKVFLEEIDSIKSSKEFKEIHNPKFYPACIKKDLATNGYRHFCGPDKKHEKILLQKWNSVCLSEAERVTTADGAVELYKNTPMNYPAKKVVGELLNNLTLKELASITEHKAATALLKRPGLCEEVKDKIRIKRAELHLESLKK